MFNSKLEQDLPEAKKYTVYTVGKAIGYTFFHVTFLIIDCGETTAALDEGKRLEAPVFLRENA